MSRTEYSTGGSGAEFVREQIENIVGRTVSRIAFGPHPSPDPDVHDGEWLTLHFTDETSLEIELGSNGSQLPLGRNVKAEDLSLSFIALFRDRTAT